MMPAAPGMHRTHHIGTLEQVVVNALLGVYSGVVPELETQDTVDETVVGRKTDLKRKRSGEETANQVCNITTDPTDQKG